MITITPKQGTDGPDSASRLSVDLSCAKCGYNLRGQTMKGQCSECGESITTSLAEDRLVFEDPKWLASVVHGLTVTLWSMAISAAVVLCVFAAMTAWTAAGHELPGQRTVVHEFEGGGRATGTYNAYMDLGQLLLVAACVLPVMIGVLLTARPRPVALPRRKGDMSRRVSRFWAALCIMLVLAICVLYDAVRTEAHNLPNGIRVGPAYPYVKVWLVLALMLSLAAVALSFLRWLRSLAARIPNVRLAKWSRPILVLIPVAIVGFVPVPYVAAVIIPTVFFAAIFILLIFHRRTLRNAVENCLSLPELLSPEPDSAQRGS